MDLSFEKPKMTVMLPLALILLGLAGFWLMFKFNDFCERI